MSKNKLFLTSTVILVSCIMVGWACKDVKDRFSASPLQATNPSPADAATDVLIMPNLTWSAALGAQSYNVYFGTDPLALNPTGNQTDTSYDPGLLAYATTYCWQVNPVNAHGTTEGTLWSFATETTPAGLPDAVANLSPADGADNIPASGAELAWAAATGAQSYNVYFGTDPGSLVPQSNQTSLSCELGTLDCFTTYYWRIDSVNTYGATTGTVWSFTTISGEIKGPCRAVLVGVADYPGTGMDLGYCDQDAKDLRWALLADSEHWSPGRITLLTNAQATVTAIEQAVQNMLAAAGPDDTVVFFFSGHGDTEPDDNADELDGLDEELCAYDDDIRDDTVANWFSAAATQRVVVLIDACYSGGMAKGYSKRQVKSIARGKNPMKGDGFAEDLMRRHKRQPKDMDDLGYSVVVTACDDDESSWEDSCLKHGVFTFFLLQALDSEPADVDGDGLLSAEETFLWLDTQITIWEPTQHTQIFDYHYGELHYVSAGTNQPPTDDGYEDNDTLGTATDLTGMADQWINNLASMYNDDDCYEVYVSGPTLRIEVDVRFTHANGDIDIELLNSSGTVIEWSESVTNNEYIYYTVPSAGTYYIRVYLWEGYINPYNLMWCLP